MFCSWFLISAQSHKRVYCWPVLASLAVFLCALVIEPQIAFGQTVEGDETISVNASLVQLNVGVADRVGRSVTNLTSTDFAVYEDDVRQQIVSFETTEKPFSLVMLLDVSGSTLGFRNNLKQSANRFIDALQPDDRVAVITFNDRVRTLTNFTSERDKIFFAINRAGKGAAGRNSTKLFIKL
ncbi:MAG: VWA domain-containing protein [Pyrinomonadaceae bacterium]